MSLGQRIQIILKEQGLKQVDFAKALGISSNYVNLIVNDKKDVISDTLAKLIEEYYGYSAQWILDGSGERLVNSSMTSEKNEIMRRIQKLSDSEVHAVLAFVDTLESIRKKNDE